jgi:hypothetical protein
MDHLTFGERTKHDRTDFHPGVVYGFEDPDAAPYFETLGWATPHDGPAQVVIAADELNIDPETVWGFGPLKGEPVMPERAAAARLAREAGEA